MIRLSCIIILFLNMFQKMNCNRVPCEILPGVPIGFVEDPDIQEMSGLGVSLINLGVLWTINDHGGKPEVYAVSETGELVLTLELEDQVNVDWEDIAVAVFDNKSYIYVSDTGNNDFNRTSISVLRFAEPLVEMNNKKKILINKDDIDVYRAAYPGFSHDCEALAVDPSNGDIFLFTKDRVHAISEVYKFPFPQSSSDVFILEHVVTLPSYWITGGDISPSGRILALTNKQDAFAWERPANISWSQFLQTNPGACTLVLEEEEQRESIAVTNTGYWTVSECKSCPLWFYSRV
ncbi:uncharacterized protein LOC111712376 [Eurytemora carolleeae]|uniref:uncharacterized protein LOC111712376 n=1 Tax=Eurytemora carolleeae TaxID=1294199 RepID=UPI000C774C7F|nr:uncharacterized protein LOC111712376 [Eurytemora carolleeae]|eukprot:XP_023342729.1 uncharacterized protein LOC111712376 [Eurytemora affinis]